MKATTRLAGRMAGGMGGRATAGVVLAVVVGTVGCSSSVPRQPFVGPEAQRGDATVSGVARMTAGKDVFTSAVRMVQLFPRTPETTRWLHGLSRRPTDPEMTEGLVGLGPHMIGSAANPEPPVVKRAGRSVYGYGSGRFEFKGVAPGDYYVLFHLSPLRPSYVEVTVEPGRDVSGLEVLGVPGRGNKK